MLPKLISFHISLIFAQEEWEFVCKSRFNMKHTVFLFYVFFIVGFSASIVTNSIWLIKQLSMKLQNPPPLRLNNILFAFWYDTLRFLILTAWNTL